MGGMGEIFTRNDCSKYDQNKKKENCFACAYAAVIPSDNNLTSMSVFVLLMLPCGCIGFATNQSI